MKKKILKIIIILLVILALIAGIAIFALKSFYENNLKTVNTEEQSQTIVVEITSGMGTEKIADLLEEKKVIRNSFCFKVYVKLNEINNLQAGKYEFENGKDDVKSIVQKLSNGDVMDETVKLTLIEGKSITDYAKVIAEKTNNTEEDVYNLLEDEEYLDSLIEKYWFITDEIKNEEIYYSLEGYLRPDTYIFENKDVSVEYIFSYILNYTDKLLTKYKDDIELNRLTVHQILTIASIVELEGNSDEDRAGIAGVFFNRINSKMPLGSDVTTYYAFGVNMGESDLTKEQINTYNPYNTRHKDMGGKIPVGAICSSSESSIKAVLYPTETDAYYFVSDKYGNAYFTENYADHQKIIQELKDKDLWYVYE